MRRGYVLGFWAALTAFLVGVIVLPKSAAPSLSLRPATAIKNKVVSIAQTQPESSPAENVVALPQAIQPRVFPPYNRSLPCFDKDVKRQPKLPGYPSDGFLLTKCKKTGSTTAVSVTLRIMDRLQQRSAKQGKPIVCPCQLHHGSASLKNFQKRSLDSFLWSIVREPTARAISHFFFEEVSRNQTSPTDANFMSYLRAKGWYKNFQLNNLKLNGTDSDPIKAINEILNGYDFIGVSERMEESVVALQTLLGLEPADVLYLDSKVAGGYDDGRAGHTCHLIHKAFVSERMADFFEKTHLWRDAVQWDEILHQAVNRSLDRTIQALGHTFHTNLAEFRRLHKLVKEECSDIVMPCAPNGTRIDDRLTDCVEGDWGCGFACMDAVAEKYGRRLGD